MLYGSKLGYNPNVAKSWLVIKSRTEVCAREVFEGTDINITTEGRKYIGSESGSGNVNTLRGKPARGMNC